VTTRNAALTSPADSFQKIDKPVRVAQIGLAGGIGYTHINEYAKNPNLQLVAGHYLYPNDPKVANGIDRIRNMGARFYGKLEDVLSDPNVEAIDICTPHHFHRPMAVAAFQHGKHVLVEKPMATHPDDTALMIAARDAAGKIGAVQMQAVGRSSMIQLREAIQQGGIGRVKEVFLSSLWWRTNEYYARIPWAGRMKIDGAWCVDGALYNQCVHYVNQMLTLVSPGPLPSVAKVRDLDCAMYKFHDAPTLDAGDTAFITATLDIEGSPRLTAVGTTCSTEDRHQIEVLGDKGRALWNGSGYLFPDHQPMQEFHDDRTDFDGNARVFNSFAQAVIAARTNQPAPAPLTSFEQIARVTDFINACYEASHWKIKKAPWSATETLFSETIQQVREQRKLPAQLKAPPTWA
jgi:predicted dehydrogenase